ncbi:hypothetical protein A9Q84_02085 [Halobacteriovorax marinus]|mgnify:CR=1 FL=1|uniref:Uncharacterized protein n=1 Tax=Halobacteriovorax marinus TaxID=97084 RepID=A0A1Y5FCT8_9BACT|nr:hypothetical protein A9Q84_02085 [Halobacteriovorax marinus]
MYIYKYNFLNELQSLRSGVKQSLQSLVNIWVILIKAQLKVLMNLVGVMFSPPVLIKRHSPENYEVVNHSPIDYVESSGLHPPSFNR